MSPAHAVWITALVVAVIAALSGLYFYRQGEEEGEGEGVSSGGKGGRREKDEEKESILERIAAAWDGMVEWICISTDELIQRCKSLRAGSVGPVPESNVMA
jgi:hypothetical protein